MNRNIAIYLQDILESMENAERFVANMTYDEFATDAKTFYAAAYSSSSSSCFISAASAPLSALGARARGLWESPQHHRQEDRHLGHANPNRDAGCAALGIAVGGAQGDGVRAWQQVGPRHLLATAQVALQA